ncbi:SDR family oxidoreductase [Knoellia sp. S7-12]|uniref:SDR family oxidoreductase n=1 Tax=Knoellia sp. S7-12 TaxID=3126698 RepID=UPI003365D006
MPTTRSTLSGHAVIVTGATSGLGRAVALAVAAEGADVALLGRRESDLGRVAGEVRNLGVRAMPVQVDLAHTEALASVVDDVVAQLGAPKVLVNAGATDAPGSVQDLDLEDWNRVVAVNLTAPFMLARAVMPHMRGSGGGLIVNVSSVAGRRGWANASAYCSTKFALTGLTQSLAAEGRAGGIRVCVLYPGAMATNWGTFDPAAERGSSTPVHDERESLDPGVVADLVAWMATSPGRPVLNEVTVTPLLEQGWP